MKIAVLIDVGFFLKRYKHIFPDGTASDPRTVARCLHETAFKHLEEKHDGQTAKNQLYRVFYYDSKPLEKKIHNPVSGKLIDFSCTPQAQFRLALFEELKQKRKVALRLGVGTSQRSGQLANLAGKIKIPSEKEDNS